MSKRIVFNNMKMKLDNDERTVFANCESSNLDSVAYNLDNKLLYVLFKSNLKDRYVYSDVPEKVFVKMMKSSSVGAFLVREIKGRYEVSMEPNK